MAKFPNNPSNGMVVELRAGLFFQFDSATNSWNRIEGNALPPVATPARDGLMSKEDFSKLNRLIVPPPQSTITAEGCETVFTGGIIEFKEGDEFLKIKGESPLYYKDEQTESVNFQIHQHTYFFDFKIDHEELFNHMVDEGKFRVLSNRGKQGPPGDPGEDGEDALPFGPPGDPGEDGSNAPVPFSLTQEPIEFSLKKQFKKGIVELSIDPVSETEYNINVKRANVGNPDACPNRIRMTANTNSSWLLATKDLSNDSSFVNFNFASNPENLPPECFVCNSELYYINVDPIIEAIENEFHLEVARLKAGFEGIVTYWLQIMSGLFDEQKASLCCALEYCESSNRNQQTRQYIESQRIQAAVSGATIAIDGDPADENKNTTIMHPACEPDGFGEDTENEIPNNADPIGGNACTPGVIVIPETNFIIQYPQCPPGFVPREEARKRYNGANPDDDSIFIQSGDPRFRKMLYEARGDDSSAYTRTHDLSPTNVVLNQFVDTSAFLHFDAWYVTGMGKQPEQGTLGNMVMIGNKEIVDKGRCLQFSDSLLPGVYTIFLRNRSKGSYGFTMQVGTQNAQFISGAGDGWNNRFILNSYTDEQGNKFGNNTVIKCENGPDDNEGWWIQLKVLPETNIPAPYSKKCGSIGPRPTKIDGRLCKEVPRGMRNPLMRENELDVGYRGAMRDWVTTKCGKYLVPDAVEISMDGHNDFKGVGRVVLCRTNLGNYTGGFNVGKYSSQIIIEQTDPAELKPSASHLYHGATKDKYKLQESVTGGNKYKCTILIWDGSDCQGDALAFVSDIVPAKCDNWGLNGIWRIPNVGQLSFNAKALENNSEAVDLATPIPSELLLYVNARKNVRNRHRRTTGSLPRGQYTVDIINCCLKSGPQYTGHIEVEYMNNGEKVAKKLPNLGTFEDPSHARASYVGLTLNIDHDGGEIAASLVSPITQVSSGEIVVRFSGLNSDDPLITAAPGKRNSSQGCRLNIGQIGDLEKSWRDGKCTGAVASAGAQDYIIIKSPSDLTTQCSKQYNNEISYAWPTFDGNKFIAIPDSGSVAFKQDAELSDVIKLSMSNASIIHGNIDDIGLILFPIAVL